MGGTRGKKIEGVFVPDPQPLPPGEPPGEYLAPPFLYNTCVDRDGDGLIRTSYGLGNRLAWNNPALPAGDGDEAVIHYVRTTPTFVRSLAVDGEDNLWVGTRDNPWQELIDTATGAPITGRKFAFGNGGYGAVVDPNGGLWSAGYLPGMHEGWGLLRVPAGTGPDTIPHTAGGLLPGTSQLYGIGIDPATAALWLGNFEQYELRRWTAEGFLSSFPFSPGGDPMNTGLKGIVVDGAGNVWVARSGNEGTMPPYQGIFGEFSGLVGA